jgi:hypothetical protein
MKLLSSRDYRVVGISCGSYFREYYIGIVSSSVNFFIGLEAELFQRWQDISEHCREVTVWRRATAPQRLTTVPAGRLNSPLVFEEVSQWRETGWGNSQG